MQKMKKIFIFGFFILLLLSYITLIEEHNKLEEKNIVFKTHKVKN